MKKISLLIIGFLMCLLLKAQYTVTYHQHALQAGDNHVTQQVEYFEPGNSGPNRIWDFSKMNCLPTSVSSFLLKTHETPHANSLENTNVAILDNHNFFYFDVNPNGIFYWGLSTPDAVVKFDRPIKKMIYPFKYQNHVEGTFGGEALYNWNYTTQIVGSYSIDADAYGTLLLPNNVIIENTLRVKTVEKIIESGCKSVETVNTKYLWFAKESRYPVLVINISEQFASDGQQKKNASAYYNYKAVTQKAIESKANINAFTSNDIVFNTYPNPFTSNMTITYQLDKESNVTIEIFDVNGSKVKEIIRNEKQSGNRTYNLASSDFNYVTGTYYIKMIIDNKAFMKKVVRIN